MLRLKEPSDFEKVPGGTGSIALAAPGIEKAFILSLAIESHIKSTYIEKGISGVLRLRKLPGAGLFPKARSGPERMFRSGPLLSLRVCALLAKKIEPEKL